MSMIDQYVTYSERRGSPELRTLFKLGNRKYVQQPKKNCDILPGLLDLPSQLNPQDIERLLKIWALFFDHIIIPDGWLHCQGPISEYLRSELERSHALYLQGQAETFQGNTLLRLMRAGIVVPALRGRRPAMPDTPPAGFHLFRVWSGAERDPEGNPLNFGVHYEEEALRMTILDQTKDNKEILGALANATSLFADWASPDVPVDTPKVDDSAAVEAWDREYATEVFQRILFDTPSRVREVDVNEITALLQLSPQSRVELEAFWDEVLDRVQSAQRESPRIRRGRLESVVAQSFRLGRFRSYADLDQIEADSKELGLHSLFSKISGKPVFLDPRVTLARGMLDAATTAQEALFSKKYNCSPCMPRGFAEDFYYGGLAEHAALQTEVQDFQFEEIVFLHSPIAFESLPVDNILALREAHEGYFNAAANCRASRFFWRDNAPFRKELASYVRAIALKAPVTGTVYNSVDQVSDKAASSASSIIKGIAGKYGAGVLLPGYAKKKLVWFLSERAWAFAKEKLKRCLSAELKKKLQVNLRLGRYHVSMHVLGIEADEGRIDRRPQ